MFKSIDRFINILGSMQKDLHTIASSMKVDKNKKPIYNLKTKINLDHQEKYFILGYPKMFNSYENAVKYRKENDLNGSIFQVLSPEMTKQLLLSQKKSIPSLDVTNAVPVENDISNSTNYVAVQVSSKPYYYRLPHQHKIPSRIERNRVLLQFHSCPVVIVQRLIHWKLNHL